MKNYCNCFENELDLLGKQTQDLALKSQNTFQDKANLSNNNSDNKPQYAINNLE